MKFQIGDIVRTTMNSFQYEITYVYPNERYVNVKCETGKEFAKITSELFFLTKKASVKKHHLLTKIFAD